MPWPFSESIKKRACRYLLHRYLGNFLQEKLSLDQLSLDLYQGTGSLAQVPLDKWVRAVFYFLLNNLNRRHLSKLWCSLFFLDICQSLNELLENADAPFEVIAGFIQTITLTVPWAALVQENCALEVRGLEMVLRPRPRAGKNAASLKIIGRWFDKITVLLHDNYPPGSFLSVWHWTHVLVQLYDQQYAACQRMPEPETHRRHGRELSAFWRTGDVCRNNRDGWKFCEPTAKHQKLPFSCCSIITSRSHLVQFLEEWRWRSWTQFSEWNTFQKTLKLELPLKFASASKKSLNLLQQMI